MSKAKSCWSHSFMRGALFKVSFYCKVRWTISKSTRSSSFCFVLCSRRYENYGMKIRRNVTRRFVRTLSSIFKPNQTCFLESSMAMSHWFLSWIRKPNMWAVSGRLWCYQSWRKQDSHSHVDHILLYDGHCSQWVFVARSDDQSVNLQAEPPVYALFRRRESYGRTNCGCFTLTMQPLKTPWASGSSWPRGTLPYWKNIPIHLILIHIPKENPFWRHGSY